MIDPRCPICGSESELVDEEVNLWVCTTCGRHFFPGEDWDYIKERGKG